ncbi:MAG: S41 family peptidase [Deltaproteobacteria bacterium]|nr:S41 family peptidase [Deltaproteobacteria bacterium]
MKTRRRLARAALLAVLLCPMSLSAVAPDRGAKHDLSKAEVMDRVILSVLEYYYDPTRIDPPKMLEAALDVVQKMVAEVLVTYDTKRESLTVKVADSEKTFDIRDVTSPWALSTAFHKIFAFLEERLDRNEVNLLDLEYNAANGLLSTLDPHSNLLPPDLYEELRMGTQGEFGGLGIKITTDRRPPCDGNLTVVEVFPGTPAAKAGLKPGDQIVKIGNESTLNITTSEAADRLRGAPGSKVRIFVKHQGGGAEDYEMARQIIAIDSVKWKMLGNKAGYIALDAFQSNSVAEFGRALAELHGKGMKGLILDLRGNPGGLLDVAVKIADTFLAAGTIVTTAGRTEADRSVHNAAPEGTEPRYPLVVLVDNQSASAAEIIAGALRNHSRALLVGQTTFGKGSVQMVQPMPGGGALKLTSGQYLIPGDMSIQAVGVAPDLAVAPLSIDREDMDVIPDVGRFSEADLQRHLDRPNTRERAARPGSLTATVLVPAAERQKDREGMQRCTSDDPDRRPFAERYETELARKIVEETTGTMADEMLLTARAILERGAAERDEAVRTELRKLGIDWRPAPVGAKAQAAGDETGGRAVTVRVKAEGTAVPGRTLKIAATVTNGTTSPIYRLRGVTASDNPLVAGHELVFGFVGAGGTKTWTLPVEIPLLATPREDPVTISFEADAGPVPKPASIPIAIGERPQPRIAYSWQIEDEGNRNGFVEAGETAIVHVTVTNVGRGSTVDAEADLSAKPGTDVVQGRFDLGRLGPGKSASGLFKLRFSGQTYNGASELRFSVEDWIPTRRFPMTSSLLEQDIRVEVAAGRPAPDPASGSVTVAGPSPAAVRESPVGASPVVATAPAKASFAVSARSGDFFRIALGKDRSAWIAAADTKPGGVAGTSFTPVLVEPPVITVNGPLVRRTKEAGVRIEGTAEHPSGLRDVFVFVGDKKVFYKPAGKGALRLDFAADLPLEPGANQIAVVARHTGKVAASQIVFVRRDAQ